MDWTSNIDPFWACMFVLGCALSALATWFAQRLLANGGSTGTPHWNAVTEDRNDYGRLSLDGQAQDAAWAEYVSTVERCRDFGKDSEPVAPQALTPRPCGDNVFRDDGTVGACALRDGHEGRCRG